MQLKAESERGVRPPGEHGGRYQNPEDFVMSLVELWQGERFRRDHVWGRALAAVKGCEVAVCRVCSGIRSPLSPSVLP